MIFLWFLPALAPAQDLEELPPDDFRITNAGPAGDADFEADEPAVAFNATENEFFVVYLAPEAANAFAIEVWGQRLDAATGANIGSAIRISDMGPDGDGDFDIFNPPEVVWNSVNNEYLVVWSGEDNTGSLVDLEFEIYGQRLDADGNEIGTNDFRISVTGADGDPSSDAAQPAVAYNATDNEYLVTWDVQQTGVSSEIFGQRLAGATGAEIGADDFQISDTSGGAAGSTGAFLPTVAWNSTDNEYLVAWQADVLNGGEFEIFGQLLDNEGGTIGPDDFRISMLGPEGDNAFSARFPEAAYGSALNEYLVVFFGDDNSGGLVNEQFQIFGQRISADGAEVGMDDFRISDQTPGDIGESSFNPEVAYSDASEKWVVSWEQRFSNDINSVLDQEIYVRPLEADGSSTGQEPLRISVMGEEAEAGFRAGDPDLAWSSSSNNMLAVWDGKDGLPPAFEAENEVYGQLLDLGPADSAAGAWIDYE